MRDIPSFGIRHRIFLNISPNFAFWLLTVRAARAYGSAMVDCDRDLGTAEMANAFLSLCIERPIFPVILALLVVNFALIILACYEYGDNARPVRRRLRRRRR
jgi:hypothetical protein